MNAIQQISLKLQMGIEPTADINPGMLRDMWRRLIAEREDRGKKARNQMNGHSVDHHNLENPAED